MALKKPKLGMVHLSFMRLLVLISTIVLVKTGIEYSIFWSVLIGAVGMTTYFLLMHETVKGMGRAVVKKEGKTPPYT